MTAQIVFHMSRNAVPNTAGIEFNDLDHSTGADYRALNWGVVAGQLWERLAELQDAD